MASFIYHQFKGELMNKVYDLEADQTYCALMATGHSASAATDDGWASVSGNELPNTGGYTTNGDDILGSRTPTVTAVTDGGWDFDDSVWTSSTFTAYYAVLWDTTPTTPLDPLIASIDFGGPQTVSSGTFTITWHVDGVINID